MTGSPVVYSSTPSNSRGSRRELLAGTGVGPGEFLAEGQRHDLVGTDQRSGDVSGHHPGPLFINMLPIDGRAKQIVRIIVIVIGVLSLLKYIAVF